MAKSSVLTLQSNTGEKEPYENGKSVNFLLMNNLAQLIGMAGADSNIPDVVQFEEKSKGLSIASEFIARSKDRRYLDSRTSKSPYSGKQIPKRNTAAYYKPTNVRNSTFVHKGRNHSRRSIPDKIESRRKSVDSLNPVATQSTKVYNLDDRSLIFKESNHCNSNANLHQEKNGMDNNILPPLIAQLGSLTVQPKRYQLQQPKERQRSLSGQSATRPNKEKLSLKNQRSASIDYSNIKTLMMKADSRSSSFASGRYSQVNGTLNSASSDCQPKSSSARAAFPAHRRKPDILHRSATMSDMLETSKLSNTDSLSPEDALRIRGRSRRGLRASSVYSPISAASSDKPKLSFRPNLSKRRASLPTSTLGLSSLPSDTSRSREFFKAMHEMKKETPTAKSSQAEKKSSPPSTQREVLHIIEEVHPEASFDAGQSKKKEADNLNDKDGDKGQNTPKDDKLSNGPNALPQNEERLKTSLVNHETRDENSEVNTERRSTIEPKKSSFFDIREEHANPKKIFSRLENKKQISNTEQNQHFVFDNDAEEMEVEKPCLLLTAATAFESDYLDNSVVLKDDDDLCDEDFHEKRLILWLMDVSTGEEAESVTRVTPPPSPDPSTQESAIRVVYGGDCSNG